MTEGVKSKSGQRQVPVAPGLFTLPSSPGEEPHLIGSKCVSCGEVFFPKQVVCGNCSGEETKEILGVNCIVVRDQVWEIDDEGEEVLIEDTFDWYAQDTSGNVWYFGEIAQEFEEGELVSLEGSWKAGRDDAKPGFIMLANPQPGDYYRQESSQDICLLGYVVSAPDISGTHKTRHHSSQAGEHAHCYRVSHHNGHSGHADSGHR